MTNTTEVIVISRGLRAVSPAAVCGAQLSFFLKVREGTDHRMTTSASSAAITPSDLCDSSQSGAHAIRPRRLAQPGTRRLGSLINDVNDLRRRLLQGQAGRVNDGAPQPALNFANLV